VDGLADRVAQLLGRDRDAARSRAVLGAVEAHDRVEARQSAAWNPAAFA
jgi:hypothetical protein